LVPEILSLRLVPSILAMAVYSLSLAVTGYRCCEILQFEQPPSCRASRISCKNQANDTSLS